MRAVIMEELMLCSEGGSSHAQSFQAGLALLMVQFFKGDACVETLQVVLADFIRYSSAVVGWPHQSNKMALNAVESRGETCETAGFPQAGPVVL